MGASIGAPIFSWATIPPVFRRHPIAVDPLRIGPITLSALDQERTFKFGLAGPVTDKIDGTSMKVDYVRYYRRK
jgi:hypothetical protein